MGSFLWLHCLFLSGLDEKKKSPSPAHSSPCVTPSSDPTGIDAEATPYHQPGISFKE